MLFQAPEHRFDWAVNGNNYYIDIPDIKREKTLTKQTPKKLLTTMALIKKTTEFAIENETSKFE